MIRGFNFLRNCNAYRLGITCLLAAFVVTASDVGQLAQAQTFLELPPAGRMVAVSPPFEPLQLKGIQVDAHRPLSFNFLIDKGDSSLKGQALNGEITRLAKYFLTCLAVPDDDLWVNLSPYEKDRIMPGNFGFTLMGRDLLAQDYLLKQIMASLSYPENDIGRRFWQSIYRKSYALYGTTEIPISTFNKVWIIPKSAQVFVKGHSAYVVNSQLDVLLEADYKAMMHQRRDKNIVQDHVQNAVAYAQIFRDVILPSLREEVNEGKNFAMVRQVFNAMILATWYKRHLKNSLFGKMYVGKNQVRGVDLANRHAKEEIFQQYLKSYKKCVYNYIKEDYDPISAQRIPRKYASGGIVFAFKNSAMYAEMPTAKGIILSPNLAMATVDMMPNEKVKAVGTTKNTSSFWRRYFLPMLLLAVTSAVAVPSFAQSPLDATRLDKVTVTLAQGGSFEQALVQKGGYPKQMMTRAFEREIAQYSTLGNAKIANIDKIAAGQDLHFPSYPSYLMAKQASTHTASTPFSNASVSYAHGGASSGAINPRIAMLNQMAEYLQQSYQNNSRAVFVPVVYHPNSNGLIGAFNSGDVARQMLHQNTPSGSPVKQLNPAPLRKSANPVIKQMIQNQNVTPSPAKKPSDDLFILPKASVPKELKTSTFMEDFKDWVMPLVIGSGIMAWSRGYSFGGLSNKFRRKSEKSQLKPVLDSEKPSFDPMANKNEMGVLMPPPAATEKEQQILAQDLKGLREHLEKIVKGEIKPQPIAPILQPENPLARQGRYFLWMDIAGVLGAMGLAWWLNGDFSPSLIFTTLFMTRAYYVAQQFLHEWAHLILANLLYFFPFKFSAIWSDGNWLGNKSIVKWIASLIPGMRPKHAPFVYLPFASAEGGWFNWIRHHAVAKGGLVFSIALVVILGHSIGLMPALAPLFVSGLMVIKQSINGGDLTGSDATCKGQFGCGIVVEGQVVPMTGVSKKELKPVIYTSFGRKLIATMRRGAQQMGAAIIQGIGDPVTLVKTMKQKRNWFFWQAWDKGPVFYRNVVSDLLDEFYDELSPWIVPVNNYRKYAIAKLVAHSRFATQGLFKKGAAHPHLSNLVRRVDWLWAETLGKYVKVLRTFVVVYLFNGDHDNTRLGVPQRIQLFKEWIGVPEGRSFFAAANNRIYKGRVSLSYLKKMVSDGTEVQQEVKTNYAAVLRALRTAGYISFLGYVNPDFHGLEDSFKAELIRDGYKKPIIDEIESAVFGQDPGDAVAPPEIFAFLLGESWQSAVTYAHTFGNHHDLEEARRDMLTPSEKAAVELCFSETFDIVEPYISRRGYEVSEDPRVYRSLNDLYVRDEQIAYTLGLHDQYEMIKIFKEMLEARMRAEVEEHTAAGKVFEKWEEKWKKQGLESDQMRRAFIDIAVERFFAIDNVAATKEFAERADGEHSAIFETPKGLTTYKNEQGQVIGFNQDMTRYNIASEQSILLGNPDGDLKIVRVFKVLDGEVVEVELDRNGKLFIRSWMRVDGRWEETPDAVIESRLEYVEGADAQTNLFNGGPAVQYPGVDAQRTMLFVDQNRTSGVVAETLNSPNGLNPDQTAELVDRVRDNIQKYRKCRILFYGFDNSEWMAEAAVPAYLSLFDNSVLEAKVVNVARFNQEPHSPDDLPTREGDIVIVVSASGETWETIRALRIIKEMVSKENFSTLTGRSDPQLVSTLREGREDDEAIKHVFTMANFFPHYTHTVSDVLQLLHLSQLSLNLALGLARSMSSYGREESYGLKFSSAELEQNAPEIRKELIEGVQRITGVDIYGNPYSGADKRIKREGERLGRYSLEQFYLFLMTFPYDALVFAGFSLHLSGLAGTLLAIPLNVLFTALGFRAIFIILYRLFTGRPLWGRFTNFNLLIGSIEGLYQAHTQFYRRLFSNAPGWIGPTYPTGGSINEGFVGTNEPSRGYVYQGTDIVIHSGQNIQRFPLGLVARSQFLFPQTTMFLNFGRGWTEKRIVDIDIHVPSDVSQEFINVYKALLGPLFELVAVKTIGVEMARRASFGGRLFNFTDFSGATVFSTKLVAVSEWSKGILSKARQSVFNSIETAPSLSKSDDEEFDDQAMSAKNRMAGSLALHHPTHIVTKSIERTGGINMSSRLMQLKVTGDDEHSVIAEDQSMLDPFINGVFPKVTGIITVTPDMLKTMLGEGYLN